MLLLIVTPEHVLFYLLAISFYLAIVFINLKPRQERTSAPNTVQSLAAGIMSLIALGLALLNWWGISMVFKYHPIEVHHWLIPLGVFGSIMTLAGAMVIRLFVRFGKEEK